MHNPVLFSACLLCLVIPSRAQHENHSPGLVRPDNATEF